MSREQSATLDENERRGVCQSLRDLIQHGGNMDHKDRKNLMWKAISLIETPRSSIGALDWEPLMKRIERGIGRNADAVGAFDELCRRLRAAPSAIGASDFEWLATFKCNSYHLTKDDEHATNYVTAKEWIEEFQPKDFTDVDPVELQAMKDTNTIWCLHIYPHTPVGFFHCYGATLASVVKQAREHFSATDDGAEKP